MFDNRQTKQEIIEGANKLYAQWLELYEKTNIDALLLLRAKLLSELSTDSSVRAHAFREVIKWIDDLT